MEILTEDAERELLRTKKALERKTGELANSLLMMWATLESTTAAIVVTDGTAKVTGFNEEDVRRSIEAGFDYYLTKPVSFQDLRSLLQKIA